MSPNLDTLFVCNLRERKKMEALSEGEREREVSVWRYNARTMKAP